MLLVDPLSHGILILLISAIEASGSISETKESANTAVSALSATLGMLLSRDFNSSLNFNSVTVTSAREMQLLGHSWMPTVDTESGVLTLDYSQVLLFCKRLGLVYVFHQAIERA